MKNANDENIIFEQQQCQHKQDNKRKLEIQQKIYDLQEQQRLKREVDNYYDYLD